MSDVSPSRRRLGRWLLAGGALALPLTASVSYAAAAQDGPLQPVDVAPSDAPPASPVPPVPPGAIQAPLPPAAPDAPKVEKRVQVFKLAHDGDRADAEDLGPGEHHMMVMRVDGPMSEEQKKHFEQMRREWEKNGAEWQKKGAEWEKMAKDHRKMAFAMAGNIPEVSTDCDKAGDNGTRSWTDDSGRQHVVVCERIIRRNAEMAEAQASMNLRSAREAIAHNNEISATVRDEVLAELDKEIVRLEARK
jgi:hypothetical protein